MADSHVDVPNELSDLLWQLRREAPHRWLRNMEIFEILCNYKLFGLTTQPPSRPPDGSLLLYDKKVSRHFRVDGHNWSRDNDGKTAQESHEKLKVAGVDVLQAYYAHGEDKNFQRRIYWKLNESQNIVLVHYRKVNQVPYREVNQGGTLGSYHLSNMDSGPQPHTLQTKELWFPGGSSSGADTGSSMLPERRVLSISTLPEQKFDFDQMNAADFLSPPHTYTGLDAANITQDGASFMTSGIDFAPHWAYSGEATKILIVGSFLGNLNPCTGYEWCCVFGQINVPAEILTANVIRCEAPSHAPPGRVPFYITCNNELVSEVMLFEFRESQPRISYPIAVNTPPDDELRILTRLAKLLASGSGNYICFEYGCQKCKIGTHMFDLKNSSENGWMTLDGALVEGKLRDVLIQNLLKDKLYEWLACQIHEGVNILDVEGQGIIHLVAALGFKWVLSPILTAGISPDFRDLKGKTALHWASYYGREETVFALISLGASVHTVDYATPEFPGGRSAADLALSRGHHLLAGYLA